MLRSQRMDPERMALYPNLDYKQLYNALSQLIDATPFIHFGLQGLSYLDFFFTFVPPPYLCMYALMIYRKCWDQPDHHILVSILKAILS